MYTVLCTDHHYIHDTIIVTIIEIIFHRVDAVEEVEESFSWSQCIDELKVKAPTLLRVVTHLVARSDSRNVYKKGDDHQPGFALQ